MEGESHGILLLMLLYSTTYYIFITTPLGGSIGVRFGQLGNSSTAFRSYESVAGNLELLVRSMRLYFLVCIVFMFPLVILSCVASLSNFVLAVPTALYGAEVWGVRRAERKKVNLLEMKCLKNLVGVSRMDRVRNEEVRSRAGIERELASRADQRVLKWFGHV